MAYWVYSDEADMRWNLTYLGDGYFKITFQSENRAVTAPSSIGGNLTCGTYTGASNQQWRVTVTERGSYKFSPRSNLSGYISASDLGFVQGGYNLELREARSDGKDEWYIGTGRMYFATVNSYYDLSLVADHIYSEEHAIREIKSVSYEAAEALKERLGLIIEFRTPQYYQSPIDICKGTVTISNLDTLCSHGGTIHTDRNNVFKAFDSQYPGDKLTASVFWVSHRIASKNNVTQEVEYNRSAANLEKNTILLLGAGKGAIGLVHELNHLFGAKDHYCTVDDSNNCVSKTCREHHPEFNYSRNCVMEQRQASGHNLICSDCQTFIISHLQDHHEYL